MRQLFITLSLMAIAIIGNAKEWVKITSEDELTAGMKLVLAYSPKYTSGGWSSSTIEVNKNGNLKIVKDAVFGDNDCIEDIGESVPLTLGTGSSDGLYTLTITASNGKDYFIGIRSSAGTVSMCLSKTAVDFSILFDEDGNAIISNSSNKDYKLRYDVEKFNFYKTSKGQSIQLYRENEDSQTMAYLKFGENDTKSIRCEINDGMTALPEIITNSNASTIKFFSTNPDIATVDNNGVLELRAVGITDIIASVDETETYTAASDTITVGVYDKDAIVIKDVISPETLHKVTDSSTFSARMLVSQNYYYGKLQVGDGSMIMSEGQYLYLLDTDKVMKPRSVSVEFDNMYNGNSIIEIRAGEMPYDPDNDCTYPVAELSNDEKTVKLDLTSNAPYISIVSKSSLTRIKNISIEYWHNDVIDLRYLDPTEEMTHYISDDRNISIDVTGDHTIDSGINALCDASILISVPYNQSIKSIKFDNTIGIVTDHNTIVTDKWCADGENSLNGINHVYLDIEDASILRGIYVDSEDIETERQLKQAQPYIDNVAIEPGSTLNINQTVSDHLLTFNHDVSDTNVYYSITSDANAITNLDDQQIQYRGVKYQLYTPDTPIKLPYSCTLQFISIRGNSASQIDSLYIKMPTGIEDISNNSPIASSEYYTIAGQRIKTPLSNGIYIHRQGSDVSKVYVP